MTPSLTFQWPLSPVGTFQPVRSMPLNSDVNPAGTLSDSPACSVQPAANAATAAPGISRLRCMRKPPGCEYYCRIQGPVFRSHKRLACGLEEPTSEPLVATENRSLEPALSTSNSKAQTTQRQRKKK